MTDRWIFHTGEDPSNSFEINQEEKEWLEEFADIHSMDGVGFWISEWEPLPPPKPIEEWTQLDWIMHGMAQSYLDSLNEGQNILESLMALPENQNRGNYIKFPMNLSRNKGKANDG